MAIDSNRFPLHIAIKKILDDPNSRPALPVLEDGSSVGDDNFGEGEFYDTGRSPDIALNNGNVVVEVHETQKKSGTLWYHVGKVEGKEITWGNDKKSIQYDKGEQPSVAITNDGLVVEVHKSQSHNTLWYRLGRIKSDGTIWDKSYQSKSYDDGVQPSIAINNNGLVVEVHKSQSHNTLWYRVGKVNGEEIKWENNEKSIEYDNGVQPSVAITDDGLVVEVHEKDNTLWYRVGRVKSDGTIWVKDDQSKSVKYDKGAQPSVAITNDGLVVEVHRSQSRANLWYRGTGQVNDMTIDGWEYDEEESKNYSSGEGPKVACNAELAVETHFTGGESLEDLDPSLKYSVLTLPAFRSNWTVLEGENSYYYCACNSATNDTQRHASDHTMNIKEGAPYLYAVLTKDDDSFDFPTGAILTITGPDGTKYDRDIEEENQLVIMSDSSVRCLIVKDPKPGDWKMTMTVPEGVGYHCECNTVPTKDVYDTMLSTMNSPKANQRLQPRLVGLAIGIFVGLAAIIGAAYASHSNPPSRGLVLDLAVAGTGNSSLESSNPLFRDAPRMGVNNTAQALVSLGATAPTRNAQTVVRFTTWNMQGGTNASSINQLIQPPLIEPNQRLIQILALQETGNLPEIADRRTLSPILGDNGDTVGNTWNMEMNQSFMEFMYWENNWAQGGMAIAANSHREREGILPAVNVNDFIPRNTRNLPWITVNIPSNNQNTPLTVYTVHAPPVFGNTTEAHVLQWVTAQINQITQREGNNRWILAGDFNLTPEQLGNIPGINVVHGDRATHQGGNILDYAVTNIQGLRYAPPGNVPSGSDHYPQVFEWDTNIN